MYRGHCARSRSSLAHAFGGLAGGPPLGNEATELGRARGAPIVCCARRPSRAVTHIGLRFRPQPDLRPTTRTSPARPAFIGSVL